jgi:hypothetical protein
VDPAPSRSHVSTAVFPSLTRRHVGPGRQASRLYPNPPKASFVTATGADSSPRRTNHLCSGRLGLPHPSPLLGPPFEGTRSSLLLCRRPLPSGQPRADNHANPTPTRLASSVDDASATCLLAHGHRAWPPLQSLTATSLRTSVQRQDPSLASLPSAVSACARRNPALRAHVPRLPNRPILPYHVCACPCTGAIHRYARHHVQPPPPSQAQAARA